MLQKKLMQIIGAMVGAGLLGMIVAYLIYGKIAGDYLSLSTIFSTSDNMLESAAQSLAGIDDIRNKILAGGVAGVLTGLIIPVLSAHLQKKI